MNKYLLRFYKRGNMRFISHLDLGRLFRRALKKAGIDVEYSNGFNPHEKINIVQPLSLGFESESEYFEISTRSCYDPEMLKTMMNSSMPEDICFYECKELDPSAGSMSNKTEAAVYKVCIIGSKEEFDSLDTDAFLSQKDITVLKRDKKTKTYVEKSVKNMIFGISKSYYDDNEYYLELTVKCAANESLNPMNLIRSLYEFNNLSLQEDEVRITRLDLFANNDQGMISLFDYGR